MIKRGFLLAGGLLALNAVYFAFVPSLLDAIGSEWFSVWVPGEGWAQTDMPDWIYWLVQCVVPLSLCFLIVIAVGMATRAGRSWWVMAVIVAALMPVSAYILTMLLLFGFCVLTKCGSI